jgi:hypothetical protein
MAAVKGVNAALLDQERYVEFLKEARLDVPIIGELLEQLALLEALPDSKQKKTGLAAAHGGGFLPSSHRHRDLVVLLALRNTEVASFVQPPTWRRLRVYFEEGEVLL